MIKFYLIKNKLLYLTSTFISLYLTYLVCRLWDLSKQGIFFVGIFILLIFLSLTFVWNKKNNEISKLEKCKTIKIIVISIILSFVTIMFNYNFFTSKYTTSKIEITSIDQKISLDIIDSILLNNQTYYIKEDKFITTYDDLYNQKEKINNNDIIIEQIDNNKIILNFKKSRTIKVNFNNLIKIKIIDLNKTKKLDFSENQTTIMYNVESNHVSDKYTILRFLISFVSLIYIFTMSLIYYEQTNKKEKCLILVAFISFIIGIIYFKNLVICTLSPDSGTYINYDFSRLFNLKLNGRTPIYPIIIKCIQKIFEHNFLEFVCIFQYFIWLISIIYLYKIVILLTKNEKISIVSTILYALSPTIISWNCIILTESIALSGTLIFIYYIIKYIRTKRTLFGIISVIISLLLTFHRPTSIIYICGLFAFFTLRLIFEKQNFKNDIKCLIATLISIVIIVIYAIIFHREFGIYSISDAVVRQDLYVSIEQGYYKSSNDPKFIENIENALNKFPENKWTAMLDVLKKYSLNDMKKHTNYCRKQNINKYIGYIVNLYKDYASSKFEGYGYINANQKLLWLYNSMYSSFSLITFLHVYILILIQLVLFVKNWIVTKKVAWINLGLFTFPFIILLSSFIGTCSEFMRTAIACVPFTYVSLIFITYIMFKGKNDI